MSKKKITKRAKVKSGAEWCDTAAQAEQFRCGTIIPLGIPAVLQVSRSLRPFVKYVNYNHIMPTRYQEPWMPWLCNGKSQNSLNKRGSCWDVPSHHLQRPADGVVGWTQRSAKDGKESPDCKMFQGGWRCLKALFFCSLGHFDYVERVPMFSSSTARGLFQEKFQAPPADKAGRPSKDWCWRWLIPMRCLDMGMSENGVYPQWNSNLVGIMIINHWVYGYTIFRHSHMGVGQNLLLSILMGWTSINPSYDLGFTRCQGFDQ